LIFYGVSYGGGLFTWIVKKLFDKGYLIGGLILDSPFISPYHQFKLWPDIMKSYDIIESKEKFDKFSKIAEDAAEMVKNKVKWSVEKGTECNILNQPSENGPYFNSKSKDFVANAYDLRKDAKKNHWSDLLHGKIPDDIMKFWLTEKAKETFNAQKLSLYMNPNVSNYVLFNHYGFNEFIDAFEYLFEKNINIILING